MTDPHAQAFPHATYTDAHMQGLTKREYFAGVAMSGLLPGPELHITNFIMEDAPKEYAVVAVAMADALIAELSK